LSATDYCFGGNRDCGGETRVGLDESWARARIAIAGDNNLLLSRPLALQFVPRNKYVTPTYLIEKNQRPHVARARQSKSNLGIANQNSGGT